MSTSITPPSSSSRTVFSIVGRNLKLNTAQDIQPILAELHKVHPLEEVHFGGNTLGVDACVALAEVLKTKTDLKVADFADIFTGRLITEIPLALKALCDALASHTSLLELDLSDNAFGGRSAEPMVHFLSTNQHLQVLKLNNNGLGIQGGSIVASALIKLAQGLKDTGRESQLRTVICGRNRLENGSAPLWAEAFKLHGRLREVRMFQNGIRMEGIEVLSQGLSHCKTLEILDFQDNTATVRGSRALAKALPSWPALTTLNLSDTLLKPKGGALIFDQLRAGSNTKLETLQLQYDDLDRKALSTLGSAIGRHLSNLTRLEINGNWADEEDDCIEEIKKALHSHGNGDALDELDEMDPEGEEDSEAEEEGGDEDGDDEAEVSQVTALAGTRTASESLASTAHGESSKIAEVAAEVSRSAQAVPEKSQQLADSVDVGQTAEVVYQADEKDGGVEASRGSGEEVDELTRRLSGAGLSSK